jgi:5-formyltetrahydrofolate cyclo-ligase
MTESPTAEAKAALRAEIRKARGSRVTSDEESERLSQQLGQYCLDNRVSVAAAYLPMPHEPNIRGFLDWAKSQQIRLLLPVVSGQDLRWVEYGNETRIGELGFVEAVGKPADLKAAEVIFLPALAVDLAGNRLGQGKGFYDRALQQTETLHRKVKRIAVVFDEEIKVGLAAEPHDQKVDAVATASKLVWFNR